MKHLFVILIVKPFSQLFPSAFVWKNIIRTNMFIWKFVVIEWDHRKNCCCVVLFS